MQISSILPRNNSSLTIGDIFTPSKWAMFAIEKYDIYNKWLNGARIFDPTMGDGNLLHSLIEYGISKGKSVAELPIRQLFGNELNTRHYKQAIARFSELFQSDMSSHFTNEDFLLLPDNEYDIIFGNPPWGNFTNLPESYKSFVKDLFIRYNLTASKQSLLLGCSRIDIAALIIVRSMKDFLCHKGDAYFFIPLSLLLNEGAHNSFRNFNIDDVDYALKSVFDFYNEQIFSKVSTRYGLIHLKRNEKTIYPIQYYKHEKLQWKEYIAKPIFKQGSPLSILKADQEDIFETIQPIILSKESVPRQGINTCGANSIFFFTQHSVVDDVYCSVSNSEQFNIILPSKFIYPLLTHKQFSDDDFSPDKWVLLPYSAHGKLLKIDEIKQYYELHNYLLKHKSALENRKGSMLQSLMKRGNWWALLGVGLYNFFPYKIVWEAYGRKTFRPKIFSGSWQVNQSLQAYIPLHQYADAVNIHKHLSDNLIEQYLLSHQMSGTMNWAQPGKIKKLFYIQ
jgi:hypothetical protein